VLRRTGLTYTRTQIDSADILPNAVTTVAIANNSITSDKIAPGTVIASDIADGSITSSKLSSTLSISGNFLAGNVTANTNFITAAGSVGAPAIFPSGDTNTGIFFPAADTIAFTEGGVESMRIDSSGNLGIGISSPTAVIDVLGSYLNGGSSRANTATKTFGFRVPHCFTATNPMNVIGGLSTTSLNYVYIGGSDSNIGGTAATNLFFYTAANNTTADGTLRMSIDSSGNVGIGTSSPTNRLQVTDGNLRVDGTTASGYKLNVAVNSGADRDMLLAGVSGITNGFTVNYIHSGTALAVRFSDISTTASAANAFLDSGDANRLYRSTSSLRYKKDIETIEQSKSDAVLNLRPVWYRSKADNDKADWSWYGFVAEEVAEIEPRLVHWSYLDSDYDVTEENGSLKKTLKAGAKLVPDGVQYDRVAVLLLDVVKRQEQAIQEQQALINNLTTRLNALEEK
jgi:hypothetical protein